jgi:hypothetical protein
VDAGPAWPQDITWAHALTGRLEETVTKVLVGPEGQVVTVGDYSSHEGAFFGDTHLPDMSPNPDQDAWRDLYITAHRPDGRLLWSRTYGAYHSLVLATDAAMDEAGALFVTGFFRGGPDLGLGPVPYAGGAPGHFLMKVSANGAGTEWVVTSWTDGYLIQPPLLSVRDGQVGWALSFVNHLRVGKAEATTGEHVPAVFFVRLDAASASPLDTELVQSPAGEVLARALALGPGGSVHLGVSARSGFTVGGHLIKPPLHTQVLVKLGPDGRHQWHKVLVEDAEDTHSARPLSAVVDEAGEVFLAGSFNGTLRFGGRGYTQDVPWLYPGYVARMGPAGEERWIRTLRSDHPLDVAGPHLVHLSLWRQGELALSLIHGKTTQLCGATSPVDKYDGESNAMVVTLDREGGCRWARSLGPERAYDAYNLSAAQGPGGEVYLGGTLSGAWPFPTTAGKPICRQPGWHCTWRWDGFLMRIDR